MRKPSKFIKNLEFGIKGSVGTSFVNSKNDFDNLNYKFNLHTEYGLYFKHHINYSFNLQWELLYSQIGHNLKNVNVPFNNK